MNVRKYQEALVSLERLHWHLHLNGGPDLWTAQLLRQFQAAVHDNADVLDDDKRVFIDAEPLQPAA